MKNISWTIITTQHTIFVAELLQRSLQRHFTDIKVVLDTPKTFSSSYYIVLCASAFKRLPPLEQTFIFQLEQCFSTKWWTPEYFNILKKCAGVLEYSETNIEFLRNHSIAYPKVYFLPIGTIDNYKFEKEKEKEKEKPIDILFYGSTGSERRIQLLNEVSKKFNIKIINTVYGEEIINLIQQSKIVLNIHYYKPALLETTRIFECLSLGTRIVSEESVDSEFYKKTLGASILFFKEGDTNEMFSCIERGIRDYKEVDSIYKVIKKSSNYFNFMLDRFLVASNILNLDIISNVPVDTGNHFVLSLSETPLRRQSFLLKGLTNVKLFNGIRHQHGWIGCALSYKHLAISAITHNLEHLVVMEDDVDVYVDSLAKMKIVSQYLEKNKGKWDIFSGFIANAHKEMKIINIEKFKGLTFITADKMTSTVFNVYSKSGIKILASWNSSITNTSNTIDRYIEAQPNLRVIFAWPFIFGHDEKINSIIWGGNNSRYNLMINETGDTIKDKIEQFKCQNQKQ